MTSVYMKAVSVGSSQCASLLYHGSSISLISVIQQPDQYFDNFHRTHVLLLVKRINPLLYQVCMRQLLLYNNKNYIYKYKWCVYKCTYVVVLFLQYPNIIKVHAYANFEDIINYTVQINTFHFKQNSFRLKISLPSSI